MTTGAPQLDLSFEVRGGRTVLARRQVGYPFFATAPLTAAAPKAEVVLQSVSGGLYGADSLGQRITAGADAQVVVRMPSATVVHAHGAGGAARQVVSLRAEAGATLAYLPRPLILFPGSALIQAMDVTVAATATVLLRDGFLSHDPPAGGGAGRTLRSDLTVRATCGRVIAMDLLRFEEAMLTDASPGVAGAFRAFGAVWLIRRMDAESYHQLRGHVLAWLGDRSDCYAGTNALRDAQGMVVRVAAHDGGALDAVLDAIVGVMMCGW